MTRSDRRWSTPFGSWVSSYGVSALIDDLAREGAPITQTAVYNWLSGRNTPRPDHADAIARLSGGTIDLQTIYAHRRLVAQSAADSGSLRVR